MRIKKVSQTPIPQSSEAQIVDGYSTSAVDGYSCNYINTIDTKISHIIEKGSVANKGDYIKFSDGTMIVLQTYTKTVSSWSAWGTMYSASLGTPPDFPIAFIEKPYVSVTISGSTANGWLATGSGTIQDASTTRTLEYGVVRPTSISDSRTFTVNVIAIGKWK